MKISLTLCSLFISISLQAQSLKDLTFGEVGSFEVITWNLEFFPKKRSNDN